MDQQVRGQAPGSEDYLPKNPGYGYSHIKMPRNKQTRDFPSCLRKMYDKHIPKCSFQKPVPIQIITWTLNPGRRGAGKAQQSQFQMFPSRESVQGPWTVVEREFSPGDGTRMPGGLTEELALPPQYHRQLIVDSRAEPVWLHRTVMQDRRQEGAEMQQG